MNPQYCALALFVDVTSEESVQAMVEATVQKFGRVDYNVNSAGVSSTATATFFHTASLISQIDWRLTHAPTLFTIV